MNLPELRKHKILGSITLGGYKEVLGMMTHAEEEGLKNKKDEDVLWYISIGLLIPASLILIYQMVFIIQPTKIDFARLLVVTSLALLSYLVGIKKVTQKSEKKALWRIVVIVIKGMIIIGAAILIVSSLSFLWGS